MRRILSATVSFILVLSMILGLATVASAATVKSYSDVPRSYWGYETIMRMTEEGIFKGTSDPKNGVGTFSPEEEMTRAEFITASIRAIFPSEAKKIKNDSKVWWKNYYNFALENEIIIKGELDNGDLDEPMTREEMAMVMVRCVEINGEKLTQRIKATQIPDYSKIGSYYKLYVWDCYSYGLLCGVDTKGTFDPKATLTRAEAATVICRLIDEDMRVEVDFKSGGSKDNATDNSGNNGSSNNNDNENNRPPEDEDTTRIPWEEGGKKPDKYTWEEYEALSATQKEAFYEWFASDEAYETWAKYARGENIPWEDGGKQPRDYTWEEFEALSAYQQMAFQNSFDSLKDFDEWMKRAKGEEDEDESGIPWENGGKTPDKYTYEEFEALSAELQMAFQKYFDSIEDFDEWLNNALANDPSSDSYIPWEHGGKKPNMYTYEEFEALTAAQQMAFQKYFDTIEDFEEWLEKAMSEDPRSDTYIPWEHGGKKPDKYTYEEFEALSAYQQMAFQKYFDSIEDFEEWLTKAEAEDPSSDSYIPWEHGGKTPDKYTYEEFEALSAAQQMAFQRYFDSIEDFEEWLNKVLP